MIITIKNKQYRLSFKYDDDTTYAMLYEQGKRFTDPTHVASVVRYYLDQPEVKAKRRVRATTKLIAELGLSSAERAEIWKSLWEQMSLPTSRPKSQLTY